MSSSIRIYRFRLALTAAIQLAGRRVKDREGLLLCRETARGESWSEASPLPGFSVESLAEVESAVWHRDWSRFASLQFAQAALYEPDFNETKSEVCVPTNGLLMGAWETIAEARDRLLEQPYPAIKFKVGRPGRLADEVQFVKELRAKMRPEQTLRLDANRNWTRDEALRFCRELEGDEIEYLEEPTNDPRDFEPIYEATGVPYALDESLLSLPRRDAHPNCRALIIKPTILGDTMQRYLDWNLPLTFSAAFESGVGLHRIAQLAAQFAPTVPCGLDTHRWLGDTLIDSGLDFEPGRCRIAPSIRPRLSSLQELSTP